MVARISPTYLKSLKSSSIALNTSSSSMERCLGYSIKYFLIYRAGTIKLWGNAEGTPQSFLPFACCSGKKSFTKRNASRRMPRAAPVYERYNHKQMRIDRGMPQTISFPQAFLCPTARRTKEKVGVESVLSCGARHSPPIK